MIPTSVYKQRCKKVKRISLKTRDLERLRRRAEKILDSEITKPACKRDPALIAECEETMLFCARAEKELSAADTARRRTFRGFNKAIIIAALALVILIVSMTAAQAAGFRVWSALVHWDKNYLRIDYSPIHSEDPPSGQQLEGQNPVAQDPDSNDLHFSSLAEFKAAMGDGSLYLDGSYEQCFTEGVLHRVPSASGARLVYTVSGKKVVLHTSWSDAAADDDQKTSMLIYDLDFDEVYEKEISGTRCIFAYNNEYSVCIFKYDNGEYDINGRVDINEMEAMVMQMLSGGQK